MRGVVIFILLLYYPYLFFSTPVGSWIAGEPSEFDFDPGMEDEIAMFNTKRVYKIVSVIQPPFMQWNETLGKDQDFKEILLNSFIICYLSCIS